MTPPPLRLLIVDDSNYNRKLFEGLFRGRTDVTVVGTAADGEEALRLAAQLDPDVITLDLEMPKMDGFTCLRILLARKRVPVIVVSSYAQRENVFKALDLGAVDFITKSQSTLSGTESDLKKQLLEKVLLVRSMQQGNIPQPQPSGSKLPDDPRSSKFLPSTGSIRVQVKPMRVISFVGSTGGPAALLELSSKVPKGYKHAWLIAQHMPDKFTRTFAERLAKRGPLVVEEGADEGSVGASTGFVCPGAHCMELATGFQLKILRPDVSDRYVPSGDRLFRSVAKFLGPRAVGVVLTGMGDDGLLGARAIRDAGGIVVAEHESSAVVPIMPKAVIDAGLAQHVLPLKDMGPFLAALV